MLIKELKDNDLRSKVLAMMNEDPKATCYKIAKELGVKSRNAVLYHMRKIENSRSLTESHNG